MSNLQLIVRAIGAAPLTRATESCFMRALLDASEEHPSLMQVIQHLVTTDHALLEAIARSELRESQPGLVRRLIVHSYNCAASGKARSAVRAIANLARCSSQLPVAPGTDAFMLTSAQNAAVQRLDALIEIFLAQAGTPSPVRMRIAPLIVAPSGAGKTFVVGLAAKRNGLGYLRVSAAEWMVQGSRVAEPTLSVVKNAIQSHPEGLVLHVDEVDKLYGDEAWTVAQRGEIYCCAADRVVTGAGWTDRDREGLRDRVFVVASGAWQQIWSGQINRHCGFAMPDLSEAKIEEEIRASKAIPDELLFRWGPLVPIGPYTIRDFEMIGAQLGLNRDFLDPHDAVRSGLNFRAIELALSQQALAAREHRRQKFNSQT